MSLKYYQQNVITRVENESTLCDAHACVSTARGVHSAIVQK